MPADNGFYMIRLYKIPGPSEFDPFAVVVFPRIDRPKYYSDPVLNGWDEDPEHNMYYGWHHEGRRFRHGAEMMGADYTQWHGVWEVQEDLMEVIKWAAEHGDAEAKKIVHSTSPSKFITYSLYDIPGNAWGIGTHTNTTPYVYNKYPDYWDRIYANVKTAYDRGLLSKIQWKRWEDRFENNDLAIR